MPTVSLAPVAELLERVGWSRDGKCQTTALCALQGISRVAGGPTTVAYKEAKAALARRIEPLSDEPAGTVMKWNDAPERTWDDVNATLRATQYVGTVHLDAEALNA